MGPWKGAGIGVGGLSNTPPGGPPPTLKLQRQCAREKASDLRDGEFRWPGHTSRASHESFNLLPNCFQRSKAWKHLTVGHDNRIVLQWLAGAPVSTKLRTRTSLKY